MRKVFDFNTFRFVVAVQFSFVVDPKFKLVFKLQLFLLKTCLTLSTSTCLKLIKILIRVNSKMRPKFGLFLSLFIFSQFEYLGKGYILTILIEKEFLLCDPRFEPVVAGL